MAATSRRVPYTVLQLEPLDPGERLPDNTVVIAAGELSPACGSERGTRFAMPANIHRHSRNPSPSAHPRQAESRGPANGEKSSAADVCCQPHRWLGFARSVISELENAQHPAGQPQRGPSTAYVVIVGAPPGSDHRSAATDPLTLWRPRPVNRAIKIMEANPAANLSMADLARATDVSVRTLQAAFRQHTGTSPMGYLRHLRPTRAHEDLLAADPRHHTVARIAHRHGFPHLGRFAATYRTKYGFNPSTTLRSQSGAQHPD